MSLRLSSKKRLDEIKSLYRNVQQHGGAVTVDMIVDLVSYECLTCQRAFVHNGDCATKIGTVPCLAYEKKVVVKVKNKEDKFKEKYNKLLAKIPDKTIITYSMIQRLVKVNYDVSKQYLFKLLEDGYVVKNNEKFIVL